MVGLEFALLGEVRRSAVCDQGQLQRRKSLLRQQRRSVGDHNPWF